MEHQEEEAEVGAVEEYAAQLLACLQWDPVANEDGQSKRDFVDALTEIAALPLDSMSMEVRRLLVDGTQERSFDEEDNGSGPSAEEPLAQVLAALSCRDVLLKCKAANAVGSICISRVAGQRLLDRHGDLIVQRVVKMATRKNHWAQGDAFFVLGWIVVIAEEPMLQAIARLIPSVTRYLHRNIQQLSDTEAVIATSSAADDGALPSALPSASEEDSNFRIYALVFLLNCSQRDVNLFASHLEPVLEMLRDLIQRLLVQVRAVLSETTDSSDDEIDPTEQLELLRLVITLLSLLVDQLPTIRPLVLELKMLPQLLKLQQALSQVQEAEWLGADESQDLKDRMKALIETILGSR